MYIFIFVQLLSLQEMKEKKRALQKSIYEEIASLVRAIGHPVRLEVIDLLSQRERTVEELARAIGSSHANLSHHLQSLKRERLVGLRKKGRSHFYRIEDRSVLEAWEGIRKLGLNRNAELTRLFNELHPGQEAFALSTEALKKKLENEDLILVDVRPKEEYEAGHIANALSIPQEDLEKEWDRLPRGKEVIAYCRGPFCVMSDKAVALLHEKGFKVSSYQDGFSGWIEKGLMVEKPEKDNGSKRNG